MMKSKDILYIVIIVLICTFFLNDCSDNTMIEKETIELSDTAWSTVNIPDTIYYAVRLPGDTIYNPVYIDVKKPLPNRKDSLRTASGLYDLGFGTVLWNAKVSGYLEEINFSGTAKIPEIRSTKIGTVTKTITVTKTPKWNLYGGASAIISGNYFDIGGGVDLRIGKIAYSYDYGVINNTHSIGIKTKIF